MLHEACRHGQLEIVKFLIEKCQSDPNVKDRDGVKPIYYVCFDSHIDIIEYLLSTGKSSCILSESKNLIHRIQSVACRFTKFGKSIPVDIVILMYCYWEILKLVRVVCAKLSKKEQIHSFILDHC